MKIRFRVTERLLKCQSREQREKLHRFQREKTMSIDAVFHADLEYDVRLDEIRNISMHQHGNSLEKSIIFGLSREIVLI